jgi:hypothetical protein
MAPVIHIAELGLSVSVSLISGLAVPTETLSVVLTHAFAADVRTAELELRRSVAPVSGLAIPGRGFATIFLVSAAVAVVMLA